MCQGVLFICKRAPEGLDLAGSAARDQVRNDETKGWRAEKAVRLLQ